MESSIAVAILFVLMNLGFSPDCVEKNPDICVVPTIKKFKSEVDDGKYIPELGENTIWVNERLDMGSLYAHSVIAHEYTHLQQYKKKKFSTKRGELSPCLRETLEQMAYEMQDSYLRRYGHILMGVEKTIVEMRLECKAWTQKQKKK
jgi:hypothetical protein